MEARRGAAQEVLRFVVLTVVNDGVGEHLADDRDGAAPGCVELVHNLVRKAAGRQLRGWEDGVKGAHVQQDPSGRTASASITGTPCFLNMLETVLLPMPMEPVKPKTNMLPPTVLFSDAELVAEWTRLESLGRFACKRSCDR